MPERSIRLAVIGGDGIGPEVVDGGLKVLRARPPSVIEQTQYDLGASYWHKTGETLPDSVLEEIRGHDAILLGAVGDPSVPSGVLERGLLLRLRFELDHYVNLRPVRLYPGVATPLAASARVDRHAGRAGGHRGAVRRRRRRPAHGHPARDRDPGERQHRLRGRAGRSGTRSSAAARGRARSSPWCTRPTSSPTPATCGSGPSTRSAKEFPEVDGRLLPRRRGHDVLRHRPRAVRRDRDRQPVRRHPDRPGRGGGRRHRAGRERQHQPRAAPRPACSSRCTAARPDIAGQRQGRPDRGDPVRRAAAASTSAWPPRRAGSSRRSPTT